jgi:hypothetical protein
MYTYVSTRGVESPADFLPALQDNALRDILQSVHNKQ